MVNKLGILEDNNKPKVLFLHGFNSDYRFTTPLLKLEREYDIASFDFPGCGINKTTTSISIESYSEYANEIINSIKEPIVLVGHSLGGAVAVNVSDNKWVKKIILLAPLNPFVKEKGIEEWLLPKTLEQAYNSMYNLVSNKDKKIYFSNLKRTSNAFFSSINKKRDILEFIVNEQITNQEYLKNTLLNKYKDNEKDVLVIQGDDDKFIELSSTLELQSELNYNIELISNTGHAIIYERPEEINELINNSIKI